jgi:hypothetical protein
MNVVLAYIGITLFFESVKTPSEKERNLFSDGVLVMDLSY